MKMPVLPVLLSATLLHAVGAARRFTRSELAAREHEMGKTSLHATIKSMVGVMIQSEGTGGDPGAKDIVRMAAGKMKFDDAVQRLDGKLPADIASLVRVTTNGTSGQPAYDDGSLQKARRYLNQMMLNGWEELDEVVFECMGFRQRNRGTYGQVVADLNRLGSQISRLGEMSVKSNAGISEQERARKETTSTLTDATRNFKTMLEENKAEMTVRKNDLAVFDFMLNLTSCQRAGLSGAALLQHKAKPHLKICDGASGLGLRFEDQHLQAQLERMMTPAARQALRAALGETVGKAASISLLQRSDPLVPAPDTMPVSEEPHPEGQWKKCEDGPYDCALLHDLMSLEWGKFRDSFDELAAEMARNQDEYDTLVRNINDQLTVISDEKTKNMESLAAATSAYNADVEESGEKEEQERQLTEEFDRKCEEFRAKISEILHTKICAVRKVRNVLMTYSTSTPLSKISDCDFTDWHSKAGECVQKSGKVIFCDDTCAVDVPYHLYDPYQCGGLEDMKRDVVVSPNENGMVCPQLERKRRCGQKLCPVDCEVSAWSAWAKCSKDCEGGVEGRTRSILEKAKNGGTICDSAQEERACNTDSCDRDCTLQDWTDWAPCSMACDGGFTTRVRKVLVPIRGQGKCPTESSVERWEEMKCNSNACHGDEICIAKQDLIIALDGSGSVRQEGFDILREFAVNLTGRYEPRYFGQEAARLGMVLFGNGQLRTQPDGTTGISEALEVSELTDDFPGLRIKTKDQTWQRGFTNMAQALALAEVLLQQGGRSEAQSAILVLSDGKYSFKYQTAEKVQELKDKNVQLFMAPVIDFEDSSLEEMKQWASQPWETNYERIPGLKVLEHNFDIFVQKLLVKFCPDSMSPGESESEERQLGYMLIQEQALPARGCARPRFYDYGFTVDGCYRKALETGHGAFAFGSSTAEAGGCYGEQFTITLEQWNVYLYDRENANPCSDNGGFTYDPDYDTYVIRPSS